jgi:hypothetical protein
LYALFVEEHHRQRLVDRAIRAARRKQLIALRRRSNGDKLNIDSILCK